MNKRFEKGQLTKEAYDVLMFDLNALTLTDHPDNEYHYQLLKDNINDLFYNNGRGLEGKADDR